MEHLLKLSGALGLFLIFLAQCGTVDIQKMEDIQKTIELGDVESAKIFLYMQVGDLELRGEDSTYLMQGSFQTNNKKWIPVINHKISDKAAELIIKYPVDQKPKNISDKVKIRWKVLLNNKVSTDLHVESGVGYFHLDFSDINLRSLTLSAGIGELMVDLTGIYNRDLQVKIEGGIGQATLLLPKDMGVKAVINGGLGSVVADSLNKKGNEYTNEAFGCTVNAIFINVKAGIGNIQLELK